VQDRKPSASLAVSTVASSTASSLGSSTTDVLPASSTTPQSTQPVLPPQPGVEIMENKGASPALENKESDESVPFFLLSFSNCFIGYNYVC